MAGGPVVVLFGLILFGAIALIPFGAGLLGHSRRIVFWLVAAASGFFLIAVASPPVDAALRHRNADYPGLLENALRTVGRGVPGILFWALIFLFVHWLGGRIRAGVFWLKARNSGATR